MVAFLQSLRHRACSPPSIMPGTDSDDDLVPLVQRRTAQQAAKSRVLESPLDAAGPSQPQAAQPSNAAKPDSDDDDLGLPDWVTNYRSPYTGGYKPALGDSSDDDKEKTELVDLTKDTPASQAKVAKKPAPRKGTTKVDAKSTAAKAAPAPKETKKAEAGAPAADVSQLAEPSTEQKKPTTSRKQPALDPAAAAALAEAGPSIAAQLALSKGELPLMLPEKLPRNKVLVELAAGADESVVDLAGDAGAVGRLLVTGKPGSEEICLDLKGILFEARILPLAGSVMVVNIQPNEARVESLVNDFIQLTEQRGLWGEDEGLGNLLGSEDEDHYMLQDGPTGGGEGDDEEGGSKKKKSRKKAEGAEGKAGSKAKAKSKGAGGGRASSKGKVGAKGGVKKKRAPAKKSAGAKSGTKKAKK